MRHRSAMMLLGAIVVAGAALRLYGIAAKSLWLDEAMSWQMQRYPAWEIVERCASRVTTHPPLYFVLLHFWTRLVGDSEAAMRSLAALAGIATIPAVYVMTMALMLFQRRDSLVVCRPRAAFGGLLAAMLVAFSPLHIHLSQQVRGYTLAVLLLVLATIALVLAIGRGRQTSHEVCYRHYRQTSHEVCYRHWLVWSAFVGCAAGAAYLHNLAVVSIAVLCAFAALYLVAEMRTAAGRADVGAGGTPTLRICDKAAGGTTALQPCEKQAGETPTLRGAAGRRLRCLAVAVALLTISYMPWAPRLFSQSQSLRHSWANQKTISESADTVLGALVSTPVERLGRQRADAWAAVSGVAAVLFIQWRSKSWGGKYLAAAGALPVTFLLAFSLASSRGIVESRYLAFAQLHWLCAAAASVASCRGMLLRGAATAALAACSIGACADCWPEIGPASSPDMRGAASYIREHQRPGELVAARGSNVFFELSYYLRHDQLPLLLAAEPSRDGMFGSAHLADGELITLAAVAARRPAGLWIVESETFAGLALKNAAPPLSSEWKTVSRRSFSSDFNFERPIFVSYLRPRLTPVRFEGVAHE